MLVNSFSLTYDRLKPKSIPHDVTKKSTAFTNINPPGGLAGLREYAYTCFSTGLLMCVVRLYKDSDFIKAARASGT